MAACLTGAITDLHDDGASEFVHLAKQTLQQWWFPAANWTDHGHQLPGFDLQVDAVHSRHLSFTDNRRLS